MTDMESIQSKVQKLLALGQSSNVHEAELALMKANDLILKHNITNFEKCSTAEIVREHIFPNIKRRPMIQKAVALMLDTFGVYVVLNNAEGGGIFLYGTKENVTVAKYATDFLICEMPRLFRASNLPSNYKNSFYMGVCQGYTQKIDNLRSREANEGGVNALVVVASNAREVAIKELNINENKPVTYLLDNGYHQGYKAGEGLTISRPIDA